MSGIHLQNVPGLVLLLKDGETNKDLSKFSPEQILLRWVNYQLQKVRITALLISIHSKQHYTISILLCPFVHTIPIFKANCDRSITNFAEDIKDCVVYSILINQIAPVESGVDKSGLEKLDPVERAEQTLKQASKIECRLMIDSND